MSFKKALLLSLISGLLFFMSWPFPVIPFLNSPLFLFVAFVPLLMIETAFAERTTSLKRIWLFLFSYLTFLIWNVTTTFWVCNASIGGGAMAIICNSLLMTMVFWTYHVMHKRLQPILPFNSQWLFLFFWIGFEYFHLAWELTWPWLTLGNGWAALPAWVQWYEFTGHLGGSVWVLAGNILFMEWMNGRPKRVYALVGVLLLPVVVSMALYFSYEDKGDEWDVVVVQPNIDPYSEKFSGLNYEEQLEKMLSLAAQKVDSSTDFVVFPETALTEEIWDNDFPQSASYHRLKKFLKDYPKLKMIVGAATWHLYKPGDKLSASARKFRNMEGHYDAFNTAFQLDSSENVQTYHKSKLVPGVERMPYPAIFGFLEDLAIDLGGTAGSLGTQEERSVFLGSPSDEIRQPAAVAPVICYESIFGDYVTDYVKLGANMIFIITNDGWWGETPGYKQHLVYGQLRAIETRRSIARSANTGISCFIDQRGEMSQATSWWEPAVIRGTIRANSHDTFFVKTGDLVGRICYYGSGILLLAGIAMRFRKRQ